MLFSCAGSIARAELSEPASWLQAYLRLDTSNPPGHEERGASYLAGILREAGIPARLLVTPEGRVNLYARIDGAEPGALILLHHVDVVPAGPGWTSDPFTGALLGGALSGRGAIDDKSLGIAQLAAFVDLRRRGGTPRKSLILLATADEEAGGKSGTAWVLDHYPELFAGAEAVLTEGGTNRVVNGRPIWWGVEVAQKRAFWIEAKTAGRGGHGASLQPWSAVHELILALARLLQRPPRYHVCAAVSTYLRSLAPLHHDPLRAVFLRPEDAIAPEGPRQPLLPGMAGLFLDTVQVTILRAGEQTNVIPAAASAQLDLRLLPDTDADAFLAGIRAALGTDVETQTLLATPPAPASPADSAIFRTIASVLADAPVVPAFIAGMTDARYFRARGIPAYGFSPFALGSDELGGIHGRDERIPVAEFDRGVERMRRIVAAFAAR